MLATGDEKSLFNGDLNGFVNNATWAERGVTSCGMGGSDVSFGVLQGS